MQSASTLNKCVDHVGRRSPTLPLVLASPRSAAEMSAMQSKLTVLGVLLLYLALLLRVSHFLDNQFIWRDSTSTHLTRAKFRGLSLFAQPIHLQPISTSQDPSLLKIRMNCLVVSTLLLLDSCDFCADLMVRGVRGARIRLAKKKEQEFFYQQRLGLNKI